MPQQLSRYLEISREFLSGNGKYWGNLLVLPTIILGVPPGKGLRNTGLKQMHYAKACLRIMFQAMNLLNWSQHFQHNCTVGHINIYSSDFEESTWPVPFHALCRTARCFVWPPPTFSHACLLCFPSPCPVLWAFSLWDLVWLLFAACIILWISNRSTESHVYITDIFSASQSASPVQIFVLQALKF